LRRIEEVSEFESEILIFALPLMMWLSTYCYLETCGCCGGRPKLAANSMFFLGDFFFKYLE
jgi:hypothetical protein